MSKSTVSCVLCFIAMLAHAQIDVNQARQEAIQALRAFNPANVINGYTTNPNEVALHPQEGSHTLEANGINSVQENQIYKELYQQAEVHTKENSKAKQTDLHSENLLEHPEQVLERSCHQEEGKTVCNEVVACSHGECDQSQVEVSDDIKEGVKELGTASGIAEEVASKQVGNHAQGIFTGSNLRCRTVFKPFGSCCPGKRRGALSCRDEEMQLEGAIQDNRAVYVGTFCAHRVLGGCTEEKQSWCVFPNRLAKIVQEQGRRDQLQISFGYANHNTNAVNCRGIAPEELERINFSALNLSPIEQSFMSRQAFPNGEQIEQTNQSHIERMEKEGRAHD